MEDNKPWHKKTWARGLMAALGLVLVFLVYFVRQTMVFYQALKSGKEPVLNTGIKKTYSGILQKNDTVLGLNIEQIKAVAAGRGDDPFLGPASATRVVVQFMDYGCPYCKASAGTIRDLARLRPDVKIIIRDFPIVELDPEAENAALAARCVWRYGGSEAFWRYHDMLYASQDSLSVDLMVMMGKNLGLDSRFEACLKSKLTKPAVDQSLSDARAIGVSVTPTFFIDGKRIDGAADLQTILNVLGK